MNKFLKSYIGTLIAAASFFGSGAFTCFIFTLIGYGIGGYIGSLIGLVIGGVTGLIIGRINLAATIIFLNERGWW